MIIKFLFEILKEREKILFFLFDFVILSVITFQSVVVQGLCRDVNKVHNHLIEY